MTFAEVTYSPERRQTGKMGLFRAARCTVLTQRSIAYELEDLSLPAGDLGGPTMRWQMSALAAVYSVLSELKQWG